MVKILNYTGAASRGATEIIFLKRAHSSNYAALCEQKNEFVSVCVYYVLCNENVPLIREYVYWTRLRRLSETAKLSCLNVHWEVLFMTLIISIIRKVYWKRFFYKMHGHKPPLPNFHSIFYYTYLPHWTDLKNLFFTTSRDMSHVVSICICYIYY